MNQTHSLNSSNNFKLVNFVVPNPLIQKFDDMVKVKRVSRTSMLVRLMETFLRYEFKQMENDNKNYQKMISDIQKLNEQKPKNSNSKWSVREQYEPPMIPMTYDDIDEHMSENFWKDRIG